MNSSAVHTQGLLVSGDHPVLRHFHTAPGAHHSCAGSLQFNKRSSQPVTPSPGPGRVWSPPGCRLPASHSPGHLRLPWSSPSCRRPGGAAARFPEGALRRTGFLPETPLRLSVCGREADNITPGKARNLKSVPEGSKTGASFCRDDKGKISRVKIKRLF